MEIPPNIGEPILNPEGKMAGAVSTRWHRWFGQLGSIVTSLTTQVAALTQPTTFSGTITTAKLTSLGSNGSMTFVNGILVSQVAAT